jgi:triacylglycerol esterase/lipase EstA (alpha/beta hydrolase family)
MSSVSRMLAIAVLALMGAVLPGSSVSADTTPFGTNDWNCKRSAARPLPVVLVHGTFGDAVFNWPYIAPALVRGGYCVYALDYGNRGTGPIEQSADRLRVFVDKVLAATGAPKVDLVGHSQGGMMPATT